MKGGLDSLDLRRHMRAEEEHRRMVFGDLYGVPPSRGPLLPPLSPTIPSSSLSTMARESRRASAAAEPSGERGSQHGGSKTVSAVARDLLEEMRAHQEQCSRKVDVLIPAVALSLL